MTSPQYTVAVTNVVIDGSWPPGVARDHDVIIESQYDLLKELGILENLGRAREGKDDGFSSMWFQDNNAHIWLEGANFELRSPTTPNLWALVSEVIDWTANAQEANGYLNMYFQLIEPQREWMDFRILHELYCGEHLIESAAYYDETGTEAARLTMALLLVGQPRAGSDAGLDLGDVTAQ